MLKWHHHCNKIFLQTFLLFTVHMKYILYNCIYGVCAFFLYLIT